MTSADETRLDVAVVGAGFCGIALSAALRHYHVPSFLLFEKGPRVADWWAGNYERIKLHSPWHDLPVDGGIGKRYPMFRPRDVLIRYLEEYAEHHGLGEHLRLNEGAKRIFRDPSDRHEWVIETTKGRYRARYLAVCTGTFRKPLEPNLADRERFEGEVMHSRDFRNGAPYRGKQVIVVGSGNSAAEEALDLVENGAARVTMLVHGPRHFIRLDTIGRLFRTMKIFGLAGPRALLRGHHCHWGMPEFKRELARMDLSAHLFLTDLRPYGIPRPKLGVFSEMITNFRTPVFDVGAIDKIRSGTIKVVNGRIERFTPRGLLLADGSELTADAVILATGFQPKLEEFLEGHEQLLGRREPYPFARPITDFRMRSQVFPSLFFVGFDTSIFGGLSWGYWGWEIGEKIATELGTFQMDDRPSDFRSGWFPGAA